MTATMDATLAELRSASGTNFASSDERNRLEISSAKEHTQAARRLAMNDTAAQVLDSRLQRDEVKLVRFTRAHLAGGLKLSQEMGWPYCLEDWKVALELGQGFALEQAGEVIGTALWWPYGETHASTGMIIVAKAAQGRGHGALLMDVLLAAARPRTIGSTSVKARRRGSAASARPIKPSANAACARTDASVSDSATARALPPSTMPTRPIASAARRRTAGSTSNNSALRSAVRAGASVLGSTATAGEPPASRSSRCASSRSTHAMRVSSGIGAATATGG